MPASSSPSRRNQYFNLANPIECAGESLLDRRDSVMVARVKVAIVPLIGANQLGHENGWDQYANDIRQSGHIAVGKPLSRLFERIVLPCMG